LVVETVADTHLGADVAVGVIKLRRTEDGLSLFVKSKLIHDFFYGLRDKKDPIARVEKWGIDIYKIPNLPQIASFTFSNAGEALIGSDLTVNLSFLRCTKLDVGFTLNLTGPFINSFCHDLRTGLQRGLQEIYSEYLRPYEEEVTVRTITRSLVA